MAAIAVFPLSLLTRQLALGSEAFSRRYPNSWMVWEAGGNARLNDVSQSVLETNLAEVRREHLRPRGGDAWCYLLRSPDGEALRLGRAAENEIVLAEPTVSRLHARLELHGDVWKLMALSERRQTIVAGRVVDPGDSVPLGSGNAVELGGVRLGFYDASAFLRRVAATPLRPAQ